MLLFIGFYNEVPEKQCDERQDHLFACLVDFYDSWMTKHLLLEI